MRKIKFRGLRADGDGWVYGDLETRSDWTPRRISDIGNTVDEYPYVDVIPSTVGQFTGLTDKNGREVYEGDRLRHLRKYNTGHISECSVVYRNGGFQLYYGNLIYEPCDIINKTDYAFEVIGNIHEPIQS